MTDRPQTPAERVQEHSLSDETAARLANKTKPSWAGPHGSVQVTVYDRGDHIEIGTPFTTEGGEHAPMPESGLFRFGVGGQSIKAIRRSYAAAKSRWLNAQGVSP